MYDCSFPDYYCNAFSALLHFMYQKLVHFIIFSLILRGKGRGSVILFQLSVPDSPDYLHVSTSRARRRSGKHRLLLSLQAPRPSTILNIPSWAVKPAFSLSRSPPPTPPLFLSSSSQYCRESPCAHMDNKSPAQTSSRPTNPGRSVICQPGCLTGADCKTEHDSQTIAESRNK